MKLSERDRRLLVWIGEQYTVRTDLLAVLMAQSSDDDDARARGRLTPQAARRRVGVWRRAGLVRSHGFQLGEHATVWLTADGMRYAGLPWRPYEPTVATAAHRHAVGLVRAEAEAMGLGWICERELREGQGGQPLHLPDGAVISKDDRGKEWRTAVEVELTRKTEARVVAILRHLLSRYDDVVYRVHPSAMTVVTRSAAALKSGSERIMIRPYPPPTLAAVA
jgi:hypothetical protein